MHTFSSRIFASQLYTSPSYTTAVHAHPQGLQRGQGPHHDPLGGSTAARVYECWNRIEQVKYQNGHSVVIFTTGLPGICFPPAVFGPQHIHKKYFHAIFSSPAVPGTWLCCPQSHEPSWLPACIPTHQAAGWPCSDGFSLVFLAQDDARCIRDWATQTLNPKPQTSCKPFNSVAVLFHV